jgi:hypothetical protein
MMKFAMGAETLTVLTKQTSSANDDLGSLVKQLFAAAEPTQGSSTERVEPLSTGSRARPTKSPTSSTRR